MYDLSGRRLGKYEIERAIGRGGMAVVYLARDTGLNRPVALKVMDPATTADPGAVARFRREAILAANLEHPHIMPVYDVREDAGLWYLAMRYVPGETLRDIMAREGPLPLDRIVGLLRPVAAALDHAHANGVTHRDVKPGNILVEPTGNVVLTDFGIARTGSDAHLTRVGQVMGTADYLAPEQIRGEEATAASDVYSLGVLLYEMATGHCPFVGATTAETLYKQVNAPAPPLRSLRPDLPPALQPILDRALNKNPALRYLRATELIDSLAAIARGAPAPAARRAPLPAAAPLAPPPPMLVRPTLDQPRPSLAPPQAPTPAPAGWTPAYPPLSRDRPSPVRGRLRAAALLCILLGLAALAAAAFRGRAPQPSGGGPTAVADAFAAAAPVTYTGPRRDAAANGADVHANRAIRPPTIDGNLADWTGATRWPAPWSVPGLAAPKNAADLGADFQFGYDATDFYLAAIITDDVHVQNAITRGYALWKGDDVELWFDTDLPGDFRVDPANADDFQLGFSPGDFAKLGPEAVFFRPSQQPALPQGVRVAAQPRPGTGSYILEAAIPLRLLNLHPQAGGAVGFCASAGDNDAVGTAQQQHLLSTCRRMTWPNPTTFATLFW